MKVHDEVQTLLPWFVNGSLNEAEHSLVDGHLKECGQCQSDVDQLVEMGTHFGAPDRTSEWRRIARASADDFVANLDRAPAVKRRSPSRLWLTSAAVVSTFLIAILVFNPPDDLYRTLGDASAENVDGPVIQVVFRPDATAQSIRKLLLEDGNQVLSGPTRQGVYRVALDEERRSDIYVARLEHHPDVIFVQREATP